ncbi:MAG: hypothetical protein PVH50_08925 [Anaerolineae bacterium]
MTECSTARIIIESFVAGGTILVAVLAIWGDWIREKLGVGPKLRLRVRDTKGNLTFRGDGRRVIYYHLIVENQHPWALAKGVQVMITGIWRRAAGGNFKAEDLAARLPLTWQFPHSNPVTPNLRESRVCDLGFIVEGDDEFKPSLYIRPNNFKGDVEANDAVKFGLEIRADNFTSKSPHVVAVSWDGKWTSDLDEMSIHPDITDEGSEPGGDNG